MNTVFSPFRWVRQVRAHWLLLAATSAAVGGPAFAVSPMVGFDFPRIVACRDVTPPERAETNPWERLVEVKLPLSVRYQGLAVGEVEHLDIEVDGSVAGLRVEQFSPTTELVSDAIAIETTNTTRSSRSLDATLGGAVPVPVGELVAHVAPSVSGGLSKSEEATEKIRHRPPKLPVVVSGTFAEGRGVFFKFKPSSQSSLEGVHELTIIFIAPKDWHGGGLPIRATARGHRSVWWTDQPTVFGRIADVVEVYPAGDQDLRDAAARRREAGRAAATQARTRRPALFEEAAAGIKDLAEGAQSAWDDVKP
jgi:hypothetical protein